MRIKYKKGDSPFLVDTEGINGLIAGKYQFKYGSLSILSGYSHKINLDISGYILNFVVEISNYNLKNVKTKIAY